MAKEWQDPASLTALKTFPYYIRLKPTDLEILNGYVIAIVEDDTDQRENYSDVLTARLRSSCFPDRPG